jgi:WD40 repeat protein
VRTGINSDIPAELAVQAGSFSGRDWALARTASWYSGTGSRLLIAAEPGVGKSMLAARLVQVSRGEAPPMRELRLGWLQAWHFCQSRNFESLDIKSVLGRLAAQLSMTVPGYAEKISHLNSSISITVNQEFAGSVQNSTVIGIGHLSLSAAEPRKLLNDLFRSPLSELGCGAVILVDGVDETDERVDAGPTLAWLLSTIDADPVPGLRLVLTTRNGPTADRFPGGQRLRLQQNQPDGPDDVLDYASLRLRKAGVATPALAARLIADAAAGNFLYANLAVTEFLARPDAGLSDLPPGLPALYQGFIGRLVAADAGRWPEIRWVLGLLVQSRGAGFTRAQLARLSGLALSAVDDALRTCAPYLLTEFPDGPFSPFHASLREYLRASQVHQVYPGQATARIVAVFREDPTDPHTIAHLLGYLTDRYLLADGDEVLSAEQAIEATLVDPHYLHARLAVKGVDSLMAEIAALRRVVKESEVVEAMHGVLTRQAHNLRRWDPSENQAFALQQIRYDCMFTGWPGMIAEYDDERGTAIRFSSSIMGANSLLPSHTLVTDGNSTPSVAVSPDGSKAAVWSFRDGIRIYEIASGTMVQHFPSRSLGVVVFSQDSRKVITAPYHGPCISWDLVARTEAPASAEEVQVLQLGKQKPELPTYIGFSDEPGRVAVTPDGRYAAVAAREYGREYVALWDLQRREVLGVYWGERFASLAITPDGRQVILGSFGTEPRILTPANRSPYARAGGHCGTVTATAVCRGQAVTLERDGTFKAWDVHTGQNRYSAKAPPHVDAVAVAQDGTYCILGTSGGDAIAFDLKFQHVVRKLLVDGHPVDKAWMTRDGARDPVLPQVGMSDCKPADWAEKVNHRHGSPVSAVDIAPNDQLVATGTLNGVVRIWHAASGDLFRELSRDGDQVVAVRFTSDSQHLITVTLEGSIQSWDVTSGRIFRELHPGHTRNRWLVADGDRAAITRDGSYLVSGSPNGTLIINDLVKQQEAARLVVHGWITALDIDDDDLVIGTDNGEVTLARIHEGRN